MRSGIDRFHRGREGGGRGGRGGGEWISLLARVTTDGGVCPAFYLEQRITFSMKPRVFLCAFFSKGAPASVGLRKQLS